MSDARIALRDAPELPLRWAEWQAAQDRSRASAARLSAALARRGTDRTAGAADGEEDDVIPLRVDWDDQDVIPIRAGRNDQDVIPLRPVRGHKDFIPVGSAVRLTPGQFRMLRRWAVLRVAHRAGVPVRWLADAFGLTPEAVRALVARDLYREAP